MANGKADLNTVKTTFINQTLNGTSIINDTSIWMKGLANET